MVNDSAAYFAASVSQHKVGFEVYPNNQGRGIFQACFHVLRLLFNESFAIFINKQYFVRLNGSFWYCAQCCRDLGDLIESAVSATAHQDSGRIIPRLAHVDVFDALIFSMPFFLLYCAAHGMMPSRVRLHSRLDRIDRPSTLRVAVNFR
jgi:hypothetical protein